MKLLFDNNLSYRLIKLLSDLYPDSDHVSNVGLARAADPPIWNYAKANGFAIVSKDDDFESRALLLGFPPKVIWLQLGNCRTSVVAELLRDRHDLVAEFLEDSEASLLVLSS